MARGDVRVGISGWRYAGWRGVFYPAGLRQADELRYASSRLRTVEVNGSFYSLQRPSSWRAWRAAVPDDFVFAVKGARFITHLKKLRDCATPLANFFGSGVLALEQKLGPVLWQLPPQLGFDAERLLAFFASLPRTTGAAAELAKRHDHHLKHGAVTEVRADRPLRYAVEVRHETYDDPAFLRVLREADVALCVADTAGTWPWLDAVTSDFVYVRLHGSEELYASGYAPASLDAWADKVRGWTRRRRDVFVYFDNDARGRAPFDAMNLAARLGQGAPARFPEAAQARAGERGDRTGARPPPWGRGAPRAARPARTGLQAITGRGASGSTRPPRPSRSCTSIPGRSRCRSGRGTRTCRTAGCICA